MSCAWMVILVLAAADPPGKAAPTTSGADIARPAPPPAAQLSQRLGPGELIMGRFRLKPDGKGGYVSETERFIAAIAADGAVSFRDRKRLPGPVVWPVLVAAQALQDAITPPGQVLSLSQAYGKTLSYDARQPTLGLGDDDLYKDSYHAQKMTFLDATASLRRKLEELHRAGELAAFRKHIAALAADRRRPAAERRRLLLEQWAESEGPAARAVVESVARERFPAAGADAFSAEELATFNRARSPGDRFDPYR